MDYNSLANYYSEKMIGRGQFSEVYRAKYLIDNTPVALKKIQVSPALLYNQICWGWTTDSGENLLIF